MINGKNKNNITRNVEKDISLLKIKYPDVFPQWEDLVRARKNYEEASNRLKQAKDAWENL